MSPAARGQDRDWLEYDGATGGPQASGDDTQVAPAPTASQDGPWLRHDLGEPVGAEDGARGSRTDPAWLAPELDVPSQPVPGDRAHDTGVPPTLAEEPSTVHQTSAQPGEPAGGAAYDGAAHDGAAYDGAAHDELAGDPAHDPSTVATGPRPGAGSGAGDDGGGGGREPGGHADDEEEAGLLAVAGAAIKEFAIVVGMALVLSFVVKTWLLQAFYIPSGSMEDTLVLNDRVIVSKLTPGPLELKRGDIIVFADPGQWLEATPTVPHGKVVTALRDTMTFVGLLPDNSENHLIKRVIGLPGDHIVCCDEGGRITINGTAIKEPYLKPGDSASDQDFDITVPAGRVWVMGDHRSNSADSRAHDAPENNGSQGSVDERLIVGRAVALVWPLDHMTWLSNPTATFAKVPAPSSGSGAPATPTPQGDPGSDSGGVEVTGDGGG